MILIDADALCRTISLNIMAYKKLLTNNITIPNQIDKEKTNSIIDGFRECIDIVYHEPRVIAEPIRHGHWFDEEVEEAGGIYTHTRCSVCGEYALCDSVGQIIETPYCPHCGALMDEVEEK